MQYVKPKAVLCRSFHRYSMPTIGLISTEQYNGVARPAK